MTEKINIIIADDHPLMRQGIKGVLEQINNFNIAAEFGNGEDAFNFIEKNRIDIATLDIEMPGLSGFEVARKVKEKNIKTKLVILTMYKDEQMFNEAMELDAMGYILKENAVEDIVECINQVSSGFHYISPALSHFLIKRDREQKILENKSPSLNELTKTERAILKLISQNDTSKEIAEKMHISIKTVENHRTNISRKLNLSGTHSLVKFAIENKKIL